MTELEKMLAGGLYDFSDAELAEQFREGRRRVERFNRTPADDAAAYAAALGALIPGIPASAKIVQPFYCDLGWRIELGEEVFVNMGCTFLDCGGVRIGARTKLGPNCQLYTSTIWNAAVRWRRVFASRSARTAGSAAGWSSVRASRSATVRSLRRAASSCAIFPPIRWRRAIRRR